MKEIKGIARVRFLPGKLEEWKRLTAEAMHIVRTRERSAQPVRGTGEHCSGTLQYDLPVARYCPRHSCALQSSR